MTHTRIMKMTDLMTPHAVETGDPHSLGALLLEHGVDLASFPSPARLERGTPVFVDASADPVDVQRRMAEGHVRMLFVVDEGKVIGTVDLAVLSERAEALPWPTTSAAPRSSG